MIKTPDIIARIFLFFLSVTLGIWAAYVYWTSGTRIGVAMLTLMCLLTLWTACTSREKMREIVAVLLDG